MKSRINWGTGLAITMVLFISFIIYLVVSSTNGTSDFLQDEDYYEQGLKHQDHIDLVENTLPYKSDISVALKENAIAIQLPPTMKLGEVKAHLYCPSDGNLDQRKIISSLFNDQNLAMLEASSLKAGKWNVKLNWLDSSGTGYYYETAIMK